LCTIKVNAVTGMVMVRSPYGTYSIHFSMIFHFNGGMNSARSRARLASLLDGDLVCWNCGNRLISGYVELLAASGPVPFFGEMTLACTGCSSLNRSPAGPMTGTALAPVAGTALQTSAIDPGAVGPEVRGDGPWQ
jgi:hypothetical protein